MRIINLVIFMLIIPALTYAQNQKVYRAVVNDRGVQSIEVMAGEYYFDPDYIIVKKDVPVELIIRKKGGIVPHTIVIDEPEAGIEVKQSIKKAPGTVRFIPGKAGRFPFYCDKKLLFFKGHRVKGMEGTIEVIE
jgi:plastocyanin domain-containing protein